MKKQHSKIVLIGDNKIHPSAKINNGAVIGKQYRRFLDGSQEDLEGVYIGKQVYIGFYAIIGGGSLLSPNSIIDDHCIIESRVKIGKSTLVTYRAQICNDVTIGNNCVIGGFVGERTVVGNNTRIFGNIVHRHNNPCLGWDDDDAMEESPIIGDSVFIGFNSLVVGGIRIGCNVYICGGSIVTKDVPDLHIVSKINDIKPISKWSGPLNKSNFFYEH